MEQKHSCTPKKRLRNRQRHHIRFKLRLHAPSPRHSDVPSSILQWRKLHSKLQQHNLRSPNSKLDLGSKAVLNGKGSKAEMISRSISLEGSNMKIRGLIDGSSPDCKGHLECRGLLLDENAVLESIPELIAGKKGVEITHEAAVGKISEKEITYLMTRKLSRDQAVSLIIRGFMDVGILGLPEALNAEIKKIVETSTEFT